MLECEINIVREALKNENFTNAHVTLRKDFLFVYISKETLFLLKRAPGNSATLCLFFINGSQK